MGDPSGCWALAWALLALLWVQKAEAQGSMEPSWGMTEAAKDSQRMDTAQHVTFIPAITVLPTMSHSNPAHNGQVCSTWGDFHYKTFDGDIFRFPGRCNYVFSAHCGATYEDFNIQLRRGLAGFRPTITHVVLKTQGLVLEVSNGSVLINGRREELPFGQAGLLVEQSSDYVKVTVRLVLTFMWNGEDSVLLELDPKYANQTCGLCGDFNGLPAIDEFYAYNAKLTPLQFGNLQKLDGPTEQCQDPQPSPADNCTDGEGVCRRTLLGPAFAQCNHLVDAGAYVAACAQDLCRCPTCPCATFAEYSRQCAHAGGRPQDWRGPGLCPRTCPLNMQHQECGSPCADTCSNPGRSQLCEDHCVDGCFCPPGMVLDDVTHTGCLPLERCPCTHGGRTYVPGASFTTSCSSCTCSGGLWQCQDLPCPGTCSVQGGAHISTYDEKFYDMHGDCSYVLSKQCADNGFTVLAELRKCGLTDNENCLKTVTLSMPGGDTTIRIQANGGVFMNSIYTQLPMSAANITMFKPSTFFILVQTGLGLQLEVQLVPLMQVFLRLDPAYRGQMCGLCGNFNQNQADDFRTLSGVVEGTAAAFANTWKTQAACPNVKNSFEDPCSLSVENENYAQHWCALLTDPAGTFSPCHSVVNPAPFHWNCLFDTCNCEKSEDCLCAALSSYVRACAARGVLLSGWRAGVCTKYKSLCPKSQSYAYVVDGCQPTCRALSQEDVTCGIAFVPVDGCTCPRGTFLDDMGGCVPAEACPCYFQDSVVAPGEVVHDNGVLCSCVSGKLSCLGAMGKTSTGCVAPMVHLNCSSVSAGTPGAECLQSCHTLDVDCFSIHCVSGCVCPPGLVSDGSGGCVAEEDCPCLHNDIAYRPGDTIRVDCNNCTCRKRKWQCSQRRCLGTCVAYGDGHFITFDGERYSFAGSCEYTLAQDHCGGNSTTNGTFRIVTENIPCGTTGVTCSKAIRIFLESYELILHEGAYKVVQRGLGTDRPYKVRYMGTHLAIETRSGLVVSWDRKTSVFIRLHQDYKGRVCGLCGNFDDNAINDFTTRSQSVVGDALEFGNSWKFSPTCPDAPAPRDPCTANPYRKSWAQKQCSLIHGPAFEACRSQVDSTRYYEACVSDACACDSGGDCECFCTAVAAYAQACRDVGVCVSWRTPDVCPLFCDYYNPHGECQWHYQPCGAPCLKTCRNPSGRCLMELPGQEGCYPKCPPSKPFFDEDQMRCVAQCGCYDDDGNYHDVGTKVPTAENCQSCECAPGGLQCTHSPTACKCTYEGRTYSYGDVIYNTTDGLGACLMALCGDNGTITRRAWECPGTPSATPFTFTSTETPSSTTGPVPTFTVCVRELCRWSAWYDSSSPEPGTEGGDLETFVRLRQTGHQVCPAPARIECRAQLLPDTPLEQLGQKVDCDPVWGLRCLNSEQNPPLCHNYELRVLCCDYVPCSTLSSPGTSQKPTPRPLPTSTIPATPAFTSPTTETQTTSSSEAPGTTCQPRCQWTEWFDEDYPKSEEAGGDIESYDRIRSAGGAVCEQPWDIECRAENFPDRRPEELGQRVHCDPSFGLVCRNDEQTGMFKMCYNYRIRLLCCDYDHCGEHTVATATTTRATTATTTATLTTTATTRATTATTTSTATTTATTATTTSTVTTATPTTTATAATTITTATTMIPSATRRPASPPGSTKFTTLQATTGGTSQEPSPGSETMQTSTARSGTAGSPGTVSTSPLSPPYTGESTRTVETPRATTEATTSQGITGCEPKCEWTEWFDMDFPTSGVTGGDMETYDNIRAAGGKLCQQPQKIECRAESYPEVSLDQIGQVVSCSLQDGLVCRNQDQKGPFNMCFNYNIRVLCCGHTSYCPTSTMPLPLPSTQTLYAPSTPASSQTPLTSLRTTERATVLSPSASPSGPSTAPLVTSPIETTPGIPSTSPTFGTTLSSGPWKPSSVSPTPTSSTTGVCKPQCWWTDWLDQSYPTPGPDGGDFETYTNIRAAGESICEHPVALQCRAERLPDVPLEQLGQTVLCLLEEGLVCRNRDQGGQFKMCFNYHIRLLCCDDYRHCPSTPETSKAPPTSTPTPSKPPPTSTPTPSKPPPTSTPAPSTVTLPGPSLRPNSPTAPSPTTPSTAHTTATDRCQPACHWTDWLDSDRPRPGRFGGDIEIYYHIVEAGGQLCIKPDAVQCEAVLFPGVPLAQLGQVVQCAREYGLICRNSWQREGQTCFNYRIRVLCCDDYRHCPSTPATSKAPPTRTSTDYRSPRTTGVWTTTTTQTLPSARTTKTVPIPTFETGPSTSRTTERVPATQTPPLTSLRPIPETTSSVRATTLGLSTTAATVTGLPVQAETSPTLIPSPITTSTVSTACRPRCAWTDWLDQSYPMPGASGGDFETYANIRAAGGSVCEHPVALQCRAERLPDVPLEQLGQTVLCLLEEGLVCRNRDQGGQFKMCFNYQIRVLCCDDYRHCPSTPATRPSTDHRSPRTTGVWTTTTTQTLPSARTTKTVPIPTFETGPSTSRTTERVPATQTPPLTSLRPIPETTSSVRATTLGLSTTAATVTGLPVQAETSPTLIPSPITTSTVSTACRPRCAWTDWLDQSYPMPGASGGDFETYANIRAAGGSVCEHPVALQCRAERLPDVPLEQLGQTVLCLLEEGLVCRNRDQGGQFKMCFNYQIRVLCCDDYRHCPSTPETSKAPPTSTPAPSTVTLPGPSLRPPSPTAPSPTTPSTAHTTATDRCQPACHWTDWLDSDRPRPGRFGGDIETYYHIVEAGGQLCIKPDAVQCEAVLFPGVPLVQLGQVVQCAREYGLICRNSWQREGQTCFNYRIRVLCCDDYRHCPSTPATSKAPPTRTSTDHRSPRTTGVWTTTTTQTLPSARTTKTVPIPTFETGPSTSRTTKRVPATQTPPLTSLRPIPETTSSVRATTLGLSTTAATVTGLPVQAETSPTLIPSPITTSTVSTACRPRCAWTDWLDQSYPMPGASGGDFETYANIRAAGGSVCEHPVALQCRAERLPDVPLEQLGQTVLCLLEEGLVCRNRDQGGQFKMCFNYQIRVLCCDDYRHCPSTPATRPSTDHRSPRTTGVWTTTTTQTLPSARTTKTVPILTFETGPSTSRTTERVPATQTPPLTSLRPIPETTSSVRATTLGLSTTAPTVTGLPVQAETSPTLIPSPITTSTVSTACRPRCAWTDWLDQSYPMPGASGGDFETYANIRAAGGSVCEHPVALQCRAERLPDVPLEQLGQTVLCLLEEGLVCRNRDQGGQFKMCFNYQIRVLCCDDYRHCPSTPATSKAPPTRTSTDHRSPRTTGVWTTTTTQTLPSARTTKTVSIPTFETGPSTSRTTERVPTTQTPPLTSLRPIPETTSSVRATTLGLSTTAATVTGLPVQAETSPTLIPSPITTSTVSTACRPRCAWTDWLDQSYPMPGASGGDFETYANIRAAGGSVCEHPVALQCRAERLPDVPLEQLGQTVLCLLEEGLVCRNRDQGGQFKMCFNYQIRVLCCDDYRHCPSTPATRPSTDHRSPRTTGVWTTTTTQTLPSARTTKTVPIPTFETGPSTSRTTERVPATQTPPLTSLRPIPETTSSVRATTLGLSTTAATVTGLPVQAETSPTLIPSPITTSTVSTACRPRCAWTDWLDQSYPMPGASGGDFETYANIRAAGGSVCEHPVALQCRAERLPDVPLEQLGQTVLCLLEEGLVCRNRDQGGQFKMCFNYQIRVLCCDDYRHCPSTPATRPSTDHRSPRTTGVWTTTTTQTLPSARTTKTVPIPTFETGPSTSRTTERVPATQTPPLTSLRPIPETTSSVRATTLGLSTTAATVTGLPVQAETSPTLIPSPITTSTVSTACRPRCAWTDWLDQSYPMPGASGGDFETYANIRAAGGSVCEHPVALQCRAERLPDVPLEQLGQTVLCLLEEGLVCRNRDQGGQFKMCFNYQIRVLCCDDYRHCPSTPATSKAPPTRTSTDHRSPRTTGVWTTTTTQTLPSARTTKTVSIPTFETGPSTSRTTERVPSTQTPPLTSLRPIPETTSSVRATTLGLSTTAATVTGLPVQAETSPTLIPSPITTSTVSTACRPRCAWTDWLDQSYPMPGASGGDFETYANIRAAGGSVCEHPVALQCRAERLPDVPLEQLGQTVLCLLEEGLVCRNRDQGGQFKMCFNYQIRVLCCDDYRHCPSTPATRPSTDHRSPRTTGVWTTTTTQTLPSARTTKTVPIPTFETGPSTSRTTERVPATQTPPLTSLRPIPETTSSVRATTLGLSTTAATVTGLPVQAETSPTLIPSPITTSTVSTACRPRCAWTDWLDQSYPMPGASGGDFETYANIRAAGGSVCEHPVALQCRAERLPDVPLEQLGQTVLCLLEEGLVCRNRDQGGQFKMCFNYQIRVLCCDDYRHCPSTPATSKAPPTRTSTDHRSPRTTGVWTTTTTQTLPSARTTKTVSIPTFETGPSTSRTTERVPTTQTPPLTSLRPIPETTSSVRATTLGLSTTAATVTGLPVQAETSPTLIPSPITTSTVSTACRPRCAWTDWLDQSYPMPGASGGDFETYANIRAAGGSVCEHPVALQCRAERLPDVPLEQLGQTVLCLLEEGLVCRNRDQGGQFKMCFNYQIRVLCCDDYRHCPSTPETSKAPPTSTPAPSMVTLPGPSLRPTSPTAPSPTTASTAHTTATDRCQPACHWTDWLDSDRPRPGRFGGDIETYYHIVEAGGQLCLEPDAVQCEAVLFPGVPLAQLGQVVQCAREYGLICRNSWQREGQTCFNYRIRVLCCDDYRHCPSTPATSKAPPTRTSTDHRSPRTTGVWTTTTTQPLPSAHLTESVPHTVPIMTAPVQPTSPTSTTSGVCQLQCTWTDWFDEDYPTPLPEDGDFETFSVLRSAGHVFCEQPQDIQCRSERAPGLSLEKVGQVVLCSVSSGLTCRNRDQPGPVQYCHNFHVRLLCCETLCASTPSTPTPSALTPRRPSAAPSPPSFTTPCRCLAFGQLFSPGDVVYNRTDGAGCRFYAVCNQHCELDRVQGACPTSSPPEPSTFVPLTSPAPGCDLTDPPRQVNESWTLEDCTVAQCEGDNRIVLLPPKPVPQVTCVNGHQPVKVQSQQEPCQYHYECECSCSGWGGSHYITFDGTPYSFWDNCTYVLVREVHPHHGNLTVLLHNHYCGAAPASARCPRALSIHYESTEVVLTTTTTAGGQEESLILFDGVRVSRDFSKNGVSVSTAGSTGMRVSIPAIGASVVFDGHVFQVQLSYSHFSNNTEGQCGTCTNSKTDDCRRPDGTTAPTCHDMAHTWLVPESGKEGCEAPTGPPTPTSSPSWVPTTPTSTPCPPAPLCELILSPVFAECHGLIPPGLFFSTCASAGCQAGRPEAPCQSLEAYAALCRARGVCSDWRNATGGLCDLTCPPGKVYKPCGPVQPLSCNTRSQSPSPENQGLVEGCFCPDGLALFNAHTDVCVPECPCVGPDGFPRFPGERWLSNCQACVCDEGTVSVQCEPVRCEGWGPPLQCDQAGFTAVTRPQANNSCCQETLCVCNTTTCPQSPPECGPGEELARTQEEGSCCPTFICRPKLCTYNGTVYGVGATFPGVIPCHTCTCQSVDTQSPTVQCEETTCNTTCAQGSEYTKVAGQCCGKCLQTDCLTPDGQLVQPNKTWVNSLADNCTEYHCQAESGVPVLIPRPAPCPDVSSCRGALRKTGCCYSCEEEDSCQVRVNRTVLRHQGCEAPANLTFCEGPCPGESKYCPEARAVQRHCTCCQETKVHEEVVTLQCPDGTAVPHTYTHIDDCRCALSCVPPSAAPWDSTHVLPS